MENKVKCFEVVKNTGVEISGKYQLEILHLSNYQINQGIMCDWFGLISNQNGYFP